jgi:hypothetical protein
MSNPIFIKDLPQEIAGCTIKIPNPGLPLKGSHEFGIRKEQYYFLMGDISDTTFPL